MTSSNAKARNTKHILLNNLGSKHSLVMNLACLCHITKENFLSKKFMKNMAWALVPGPFWFQRNICKKESEEVYLLIWTNIDSFAIKYIE